MLISLTKMTRALCGLLCAALLLLCLPVASAAVDKDACGCGRSPVILLPGYSGPQLVQDLGTVNEEKVWPISIQGDNTQTLLEGILAMLPKLLADANGNRETVIKKAGETLAALTERIAMRPDGTSKYNIRALPEGAHASRWDVMLKNGQRLLNNQRPITESFIGAGDGHTTADHVYFFASDWRMGEIENARQLDAYIQQVKEDSGHAQVSLFGVSYGGLLAATYFTYYGEKGDIDRCVLHAPALDGSTLAVDLLKKKDFAFDAASLVDFLMVFLNIESVLDQRIAGLDLQTLSGIAVEVLRRYLVPEILLFGSFWDIIPTAQYEALKAEYLDPVANAAIIRASDRVHREVMPFVAETLRKMQLRGVKIMNISGFGVPLGGGSSLNSDYVIEVQSTTGAAALALGESWQQGCFAGIRRRCTDPNHRHLSPCHTVDAASAYLPEHTWFFGGQYHGQAAWDAYGAALYCKWLFSDEIRDIYSHPDYPQFRDSCNPTDALELRFSGSISGYLTENDETLLLTNTSRSYALSVHAVHAEGLDFNVNFFSNITVQPGETIRLRYETVLPYSEAVFGLRVNYTRETAPPIRETRTFRFSALPAGEARPAFLTGAASPPGNLAPLRFPPRHILLLLTGGFLSVALTGLCAGLAKRRRTARAVAKP